MYAKKFQCNICNQYFLYHTDLIKHIKVHMVKPSSACRVSVITHTSAAQNLLLSNPEPVFSSENRTLISQTSTQSKSTSPKNGQSSSTPKLVSTPNKPTEYTSERTGTFDVQRLASNIPESVFSNETSDDKISRTSTTSRSESTSPKNGQSTSEPIRISTPKKPTEYTSERYGISDVQILVSNIPEAVFSNETSDDMISRTATSTSMISRTATSTSMISRTATASRSESTSPKIGQSSSGPKDVCTPKKHLEYTSKRTDTSNVQNLSPENTASVSTKEISAIPVEKETATASKIKTKSFKKGKKTTKKHSENTDSSTAGACANPTPIRKKEFFCQFCQEHFDSKPELQRHFELKHQVETPFKCILCKQEYQKEGALSYHERDHHADRIIYRCSNCLRRFLTQIGLLAHKCSPKQKRKDPLSKTKTNQSQGNGSQSK